MDFLGVRFEVGGGKITPCLKSVRIMQETSHKFETNLARKYTSIGSFRKYSFFCLDLLNFADVSIFLQKIEFFIQKSTSTQKVPLEIF